MVFALHVFTIVDSAFTYHLGTTPTLLDLLDTVNATEHGKNITPDEIEVYIQKMADLSAEIDAKVAAAEAAATRAEEAAANFEVDDTLSVAGKAADAAATGAKLSQLSSEILDYETAQKHGYKRGRIYFDDSELESGFIYWKTGVHVDNADLKHTGYISLHDAEKIGLSRAMVQFAFYDESKNYVDGVLIENGHHDYVQYDIPSNAYYVRLSMDKNYTDKVYYTLSVNEIPFDDFIIVNDNPSSCPDFQRIRDGVEFATGYKNAKVFVKRGVYNLLNEFSNEISSSLATQFGIGVGNGVHVVGESGAIINALYSGTDSNVFQYFSPFYALSNGGGFTLENLEINSSNCRYTVHDELAGADVVSVHKYKNCRMTHDNTGAESYETWYQQCIGGGLALHGYIEIDGCYFNGKRAETVNMSPLVSYHNCDNPLAQSFITIKNCYFDNKGTFRATWYGTSTYESIVTLCNNSFGSYPWTQAEGNATVENMFIRKFLNEVRS